MFVTRIGFWAGPALGCDDSHEAVNNRSLFFFAGKMRLVNRPQFNTFESHKHQVG